jgi:hypothetical protein
MSIHAADENLEERGVKSAEQARDLGEVFTPVATVQEMLDLLPLLRLIRQSELAVVSAELATSYSLDLEKELI